MAQFKEVIKKDFKIITTIEDTIAFSDGLPESNYTLESDRAIPLLDSIILMSGVLYVESDPEGLIVITYTDKTTEPVSQATKLINEFDYFFNLISYLQGFRDKKF